ncbi:MAG: ABC transporter substrate-binding protein [Betaproteobacteria bacterium]|nr:ABC transporter substrate-binding protein [Betaproteobacteria bacterium]MDE2623070.1 ABC transporter substrate-binding protein [Betaproteobacteria bacterium]
MKTKKTVVPFALRSSVAALALTLGLAIAMPSQAQISDGVVRIGVLTDMSGAYSDLAGPGAVIAAHMAVEDFIARQKPAFKIDIVSADHQDKGDIASNKAREWFDRGQVDVVTELVSSTTALAVMKVAKEKNKIALITGAGSSRITNTDCNDVSVHWVYDTYATGNGTGKAVVKQGGKTWYFLTADYAFGQSLERDTTAVIEANGGKVLGSVRHPFPSTDLSSYLLKAQASGAQVIGLANAGADTINSIKQASEFGITPKQTLAGLLMFITDINSLGLKATQGMYLTEAFYWDMNPETRAWSKRFYARHKKMPTMVQAGLYSAITHYLEAVKAVNSDDTQKVMAQMKKMPVNDFFARNGKIRNDGLMMHDMYLMQVKKPSESHYPWDYYNVRATIPAADAFQPLSQSRCPLVHK